MGLVGRLLCGPIGGFVEDEIVGDGADDCDEIGESIADCLEDSLCASRRLIGLPGPIATVSDLFFNDEPRGRSLVEAVFRDPVKPVVGSVVCCDLAGVFEHSGIYVGRNRIIHRDGDGFLASVSPREFLGRLGGLNPALSVFVSCDDDGAVGDGEIAACARRSLKDRRINRGYNLIFNNCHQFCRYCVTQNRNTGVHNCSFTSLARLLKRRLGLTNWRPWDFV